MVEYDSDRVEILARFAMLSLDEQNNRLERVYRLLKKEAVHQGEITDQANRQARTEYGLNLILPPNRTMKH